MKRHKEIILHLNEIIMEIFTSIKSGERMIKIRMDLTRENDLMVGSQTVHQEHRT